MYPISEQETVGRKPMWLSKSRIMSGLQCPKRAYLETYRPDLIGNSNSAAVFKAGRELGELARTLHPTGILIQQDNNLKTAITETAEYLAEEGNKILFESTFSHDGVLIRADILQREKDAITVSEVKASTKVKDYHLSDCAIQAWVIEKAGYKIDRFNLAHINTSFSYQGGGNYDGIFVQEDITQSVCALVTDVEVWVIELRDVLAGDEPEISIAKHCTHPYICPFIAHCKPPVSKYHVTQLPGKGKIVDTLISEGINDIRDIPKGRLSNAAQERVRQITISGKEEIDLAAAKILNKLTYPRYYLDFETIGSAIPRWIGTRPYQTLPFQWSCHIENEDGSLEHKEFLETSGKAPMRALAESLIGQMGLSGPILMYTSYEKTVIEDLVKLFPDLKEGLECLINRLFDLHPVVRDSYYHPDMCGSWSIKAVLPVIAPDLSYKELGEVQDGMAAGEAYLEMLSSETSEQRKKDIEFSLLEYCKLDTLAMVKINQHLTPAKTSIDIPTTE